MPGFADAPDQRHRRRSRVRAALRCPQCRGSLADEPDALRCAACDVRYPFLEGSPFLMTEQSRRELHSRLESDDGMRMAQGYTEGRQADTGPFWVRLLRPPPIMHRYHADLRQPPTSILFESSGGAAPLVLNVGGGPYRVSAEEITLNIGPFRNVDLVADAHNIPAADNSFDAVFSLAVLEHVTDPYRVVAEMIRVLKPGGYLYSEVPFIFFFHGYPSDYTRFTLEGMKRLFAALEGARFGMTHGPVSALLQSGNMVLQMFLPERARILRKLVNGAYRWALCPLKYLDLTLRGRPEAHILAGGFYVLGQKHRGP